MNNHESIINLLSILYLFKDCLFIMILDVVIDLIPFLLIQFIAILILINKIIIDSRQNSFSIEVSKSAQILYLIFNSSFITIKILNFIYFYYYSLKSIKSMIFCVIFLYFKDCLAHLFIMFKISIHFFIYFVFYMAFLSSFYSINSYFFIINQKIIKSLLSFYHSI